MLDFTFVLVDATSTDPQDTSFEIEIDDVEDFDTALVCLVNHQRYNPLMHNIDNIYASNGISQQSASSKAIEKANKKVMKLYASFKNEEYEDVDYSQNMHCDTYGTCGGASCKQYFECHKQ